jgi:hypothetical protein
MAVVVCRLFHPADRQVTNSHVFRGEAPPRTNENAYSRIPCLAKAVRTSRTQEYSALIRGLWSVSVRENACGFPSGGSMMKWCSCGCAALRRSTMCIIRRDRRGICVFHTWVLPTTYCSRLSSSPRPSVTERPNTVPILISYILQLG